tara:strand:+ start:1167 stop:1424 length:258 start_codon:yes stop_codon:yes gene_type:complete
MLSANDNQPRAFSRANAASYCGITPSAFGVWQSKGIVPGPIPGTRRWDRRALDHALDRLSGIEDRPAPASALDAWLERQSNASSP